jgi:hypothetical protein
MKALIDLDEGGPKLAPYPRSEFKVNLVKFTRPILTSDSQQKTEVVTGCSKGNRYMTDRLHYGSDPRVEL